MELRSVLTSADARRRPPAVVAGALRLDQGPRSAIMAATARATTMITNSTIQAALVRADRAAGTRRSPRSLASCWHSRRGAGNWPRAR